jgi:Plasmid pRiA4b ORF-3-like protein
MSYVDRIARLQIQLDDLEPVIWRRVEVPLTSSLKGLHEVIQAVMLFEDYHLFQFDIADKRYGIPDPEWDHMREVLDAKNTKLGAVIDRGVSTFSYTYDFGDNWQHTVTIEATGDADLAVEYPRFIDGAMRAPPEDVGGIPGFEMFMDAMADPSHDEHRNLVRWYGGKFDPKEIDLKAIKQRVSKLARRRALGKAAFAKSQNRGT